jgi:hypothetical protein
MKDALGAKNKFDFVDDTILILIPLKNLLHRASFILIMQSVYGMSWRKVFSMPISFVFSHDNFTRISALQFKMYGLKQGMKPVSEFFTVLKILWEELEAYLPTSFCNCPHKCSCITGVTNARTQHDLIRTIRFLTILNDFWSSQIQECLKVVEEAHQAPIMEIPRNQASIVPTVARIIIPLRTAIENMVFCQTLVGILIPITLL